MTAKQFMTIASWRQWWAHNHVVTISRHLKWTTNSRPRTQAWFVLVIISACHCIDADIYVLHTRIVKAYVDELLCCVAAGKAADARLCPLKFFSGCEGPFGEFSQELHTRTILVEWKILKCTNFVFWIWILLCVETWFMATSVGSNVEESASCNIWPNLTLTLLFLLSNKEDM